MYIKIYKLHLQLYILYNLMLGKRVSPILRNLKEFIYLHSLSFFYQFIFYYILKNVLMLYNITFLNLFIQIYYGNYNSL